MSPSLVTTMRTPLDLSLYLVTGMSRTGDRSLFDTVRDAVAGGVSVVQLRDPEASDDDFVGLGLLLRQALNGTGVPLLVNDRVHLVRPIGADGAHVGQSDMDPVTARAELGPTAYLGLSCTTLDQVREASELPAGTIDYLGVGPVWSTDSKPDHAMPLGITGLAACVEVSTLPTVAIGGIDRTRLPQVARTRVDGVAVVSAICAAADARTAAHDLSLGWQEVHS